MADEPPKGPSTPNPPGRYEDGETGVAVKARPKTKKPAMYKVLMLNDDYTPMEFVVHVLERFFNMNNEALRRASCSTYISGAWAYVECLRWRSPKPRCRR